MNVVKPEKSVKKWKATAGQNKLCNCASLTKKRFHVQLTSGSNGLAAPVCRSRYQWRRKPLSQALYASVNQFMSINQKDIKLLWGRSGNRCAICKTELTQDKVSVTAAFTLGEQAHIVGEKENAARGKSPLSEKERNSYHNLILLCPNHHTEIDDNEEDWPVEKLHQVKSEHELWVVETLSETVDHVSLAKKTSITTIIDAAVTLCWLEEWNNWTSFALSPDPEWPKELPDKIYSFRQKVIAAIWPNEFDELKRATITFSVLLHRAAQTFLEHSDIQGDRLYPFKFYGSSGKLVGKKP